MKKKIIQYTYSQIIIIKNDDKGGNLELSCAKVLLNTAF